MQNENVLINEQPQQVYQIFLNSKNQQVLVPVTQVQNPQQNDLTIMLNQG